MKTIYTLIIATTFSLIALHTTAQVKFNINSNTETATVAMNKIGTNGTELKFENTANGSFVKWETATETNTSHFELQVSDDNNTFTTIRKIAASDATAWATNYETKFTKRYLSAAKVYYRVKTVFTNGTEVFTTATAFQVTNNNGVSYASIH